ncbi:M20 aminoacylase family protein [Agrobacterium pusense]|uniref:M20 aminoacylase family protein n=1 Tax=Agrobacterium pusense TaxID=648995 RepID=UPI000514685A|nr:M20 aminoacylase family protein [Agrobacterium pusense]ANV27101.1 amidohydrolase [Rhizobium sp. S41]KGE82337.1 amidohydrolase [Rhizobium sp. H41]QWW76137.1 amidohydrolase [Agrobacterium pusense]
MNIHIDGARPQDDAERGILAFIEESIAIRRDLHRHPELSLKEKRTAALIARYLLSFGYEVTEGVGGHGVVATLKRGHGEKRLGIRADIDALPIAEETGLAYASDTPGVMHACGHDGHTTILLAAARYLAETSSFSGTLTLIFQPAEEIGAGARAMIKDRLFERFPVDAVFGLHNWPGVEAGQFGFVEGPAMASVDKAKVRIVGRGGHGAAPHETVDPVLASASFVTALQSIVSRNVDPREMAVLTVGSIHGGTASNVIPESVELQITARAFSPLVRDRLEERLPALAKAQAESFGAKAEVAYSRGFPPVINHAVQTAFAQDVARRHFPPGQIAESFQPRTASEDFAFMLQGRPGSYLFVGNGDSAPLHSPHYDFNDTIIAPAARFWVRLAEDYLS